MGFAEKLARAGCTQLTHRPFPTIIQRPKSTAVPKRPPRRRTAKQFANYVSSLRSEGRKTNQLLNVYKEECSKPISCMSGQSYVQLMLALAESVEGRSERNSLKRGELFSVLVDDTAGKAHSNELSLYNCAGIARAYSLLRFRQTEFFEAALQIAEREISENGISGPESIVKIVDICNAASSVGIVGFGDNLERLLRLNLESVMANGHPGTISNLLWSLAKNEVRDIDLAKELCDKIVEDRERLLLGEGLGVKNIALVCWSFAKLRIDPKVLFDDIARSKVDDIASATPFQICQILHSYSSLGKFDVDFFEEIASRCGETLIKEGNSIDVANVLWSLTTANALERKGCVDLATGLWRRVATNANGEVDNMGVESLVQCVQFFISVRHRLEIEEPGEDLMRNMQLAVLVQDASASDGQRQLSEYLKEECDFQHELEVAPLSAIGDDRFGNILKIDLASVSELIAVEFNGPNHFLLASDGEKRQPTGSTKFKRRFLQELGWQLISCDWLMWAHNKDKAKEFIKVRLTNLRKYFRNSPLASCHIRWTFYCFSNTKPSSKNSFLTF